MTKHIISSSDALSLLNKLLVERIPVYALSMWGTGSLAALSGFIDSISAQNAVVISVERPPSQGPGFVSLRVSGRDAEFSYCDWRELPPEMQAFVPKFGDTVLLAIFLDSKEILALTFTL